MWKGAVRVMRVFVVARVFVIVGLVCLLSRPAAAISCEEVRGFVEKYGASLVLAYAKSTGATPQEIRRGRACLDRRHAGLKRRIGRISNGGWESN